MVAFILDHNYISPVVGVYITNCQMCVNTVFNPGFIAELLLKNSGRILGAGSGYDCELLSVKQHDALAVCAVNLLMKYFQVQRGVPFAHFELPGKSICFVFARSENLKLPLLRVEQDNCRLVGHTKGRQVKRRYSGDVVFCAFGIVLVQHPPYPRIFEEKTARKIILCHQQFLTADLVDVRYGNGSRRGVLNKA